MNPLLLAKLGAYAAIVIAVLWIAHALEVKGENKIRAEDTAALSEFQQRMARIIVADASTNTDAVAALKKENDSLRDLLAPDVTRPVHPVRLCVPTHDSLATTAPPTATGGAQRGTATAAGVQPVLGSVTAGEDIGPTMRVLTAVADRLSALNRAWLARERGLQRNADVP